MNLPDAIQKADQILDEERYAPSVRYVMATADSVINTLAGLAGPLRERGQHPRTVQEQPETFQFKSTNFDLLCSLLDQVTEQGRPAILSSALSRIFDAQSYRHRYARVLDAGTWQHCSSELPLVVEFLVRCGDKQRFIQTISKAASSPGLTLLLLQLEEMIALNFTLFTDEEYTELKTAIEHVKMTVADPSKKSTPGGSTVASNTFYHVFREVPKVCASVVEGCRKAKYLYVKGSLLAGMNLEVNQDKSRVRTFLEKLGFSALLIQSLDEAERLYRTAATPFEQKTTMGHLRSFLEQLHLQACTAAQKKCGGSLPTGWGEALVYLRTNNVLTEKEEQFAAKFYTLMSDTGVHPLVAEREYARLMRNMSIEYGLLLLTKLDKLGLN